jgi:hypothetical protein
MKAFGKREDAAMDWLSAASLITMRVLPDLAVVCDEARIKGQHVCFRRGHQRLRTFNSREICGIPIDSS